MAFHLLGVQQFVCIALNWIGPEQVLCICGLVPPGRSQVEAVYLLKNPHSCCQGRLAHPYLEFPFSPAPWGTGVGFQTPPCFWSTLLTYCLLWASLVAQLVRNLPAVGRPRFNPWVCKIPWRRGRLLTLVFWPGEFQCPCTYALVLIIIMDLEVSLGLGKPKWKRIMTGNASCSHLCVPWWGVIFVSSLHLQMSQVYRTWEALLVADEAFAWGIQVKNKMASGLPFLMAWIKDPHVCHRVLPCLQP